ncbi:hypothetical protein [Yinghuangia soli]|uniref:Uncharacterized protein n=1 Tax=Yinghuangia soli TaxID=2908204 RepID=A0AA41Q9Z7_9ACTN|nr:hypothetical protein [Yinghuangia soli]MCF2533992.1 hypothetical protein [Yinghuangia soli]
MSEHNASEVPVVGSVVRTIYGDRQVMDVLTPPDREHAMVYIRPVGGGREATVRLSEWPRVVSS